MYFYFASNLQMSTKEERKPSGVRELVIDRGVLLKCLFIVNIEIVDRKQIETH